MNEVRISAEQSLSWSGFIKYKFVFSVKKTEVVQRKNIYPVSKVRVPATLHWIWNAKL